MLHKFLAELLNQKMKDKEFLQDIHSILRLAVVYDNLKAWEVVRKELIEKFIDTTLEGISADDVENAYDTFVESEREKAFDELAEKENLHKEELRNVIDTYIYDGRKPLDDDIAKTLQVKPKLLERNKILPRLLDKIIGFVETFYER